MSQAALYRNPVVLDHVAHRDLKLVRVADHSAASTMHATFLASAEFTSAAHDFVIMFVSGQVDGQALVEPIALLGVEPGENLYLDGTRWDARYVPAYIRRYPFLTTRLEGLDDPVLMFDQGCVGFSETEGDALYASQDVPAPRLVEAIDFLREFEIEAGRTMGVCARLAELGLFREMSANVRLADGRELALDGLVTIDEVKLQALPDAQVIEMHRSGMLGLIHAHLLSLANMQSLVERKAKRMQQATTN